jgi:molybdopterin molybdotransferase
MSSVSQPAGVVSFEDARHMVERHASQLSPGGVESTGLLSASGRVLAEPISADRDLPPFPRATRDGYAVRAADVAQVPVRLALIGESKAGALDPQLRITPGQAVAIMTGAPLPPGADAVVMVEYTSQAGQTVEVKRSVTAGENYVPRAAEARQGQLLVDRGTLLDPATIAIAASVGMSRLPVFWKPRVAVLSTGDEIVSVETTPGPAQIRNSNTYSLASQVLAAGGEPVTLPIAPDEPGRLRSLIEQGLSSDLLLLTGGVSMGKYDLVEQVLAELKAEFYFTGAQIQPGRPIVFGSCRSSCGAGALARESSELHSNTQAAIPAPRKYFFGLPGNPVSTMVTFELFVRPMLQALAGMKPRPLIFLKARLKSEIRTKTGLKRFLPALLSGEFENAEIELARWEGSGDVAALARANCYLVIPPDREQIGAGEWVSLLMR